MANISAQRDLVNTFKKETLLNVGILGKVQPLSTDLSRLLKENSLEKPTQNLFNHLAHYLVSIIDPQVVLPWPLYDTKTERTYRNELSMFITDYSSKGLLAPVMSSYLVNPGCYKVIFLMFQMSQLAVQRVLVKKMNKEHQKKLYNEMTEKFKMQNDDGFVECVDKETEMMLLKFSDYLRKREVTENAAKKIRERIMHMEKTLATTNAQGMIDNLVDGYLKLHPLDTEAKKEFLKIKNVYAPPDFFNKWLEEVDKQMNQMESDWETKMTPFVQISQKTLKNTETLIARQTGEADSKTFMVEYNPKTDDFRTDELEKQVNSQQKYILKNITKDGKLIFPNLIRSFLISICFILKNAEIGDEIFRFNEYLEGGSKNYSEIVSAMRVLIERVMKAEERLQPQQVSFRSSSSVQDVPEIPPLPDLSDLKLNREYHPQVIFDPFTPLNLNKHQFNLLKQKSGSFVRPMPKSLLITPFHVQRDEFFKPIINFQYDNMNSTQNPNMSMISHVTSRGNETIADCTSGFTKQQICRLLSTKKSSSSKKFKYKTERPDIKIKKGGLFNESTNSNESIPLFRSHSSPNLYENREKRPRGNMRSRKLSIMKEDSPSLLEVSGIAALERDSSHSTPQGMLESTRKLIDASSLPSLSNNATMRSDISNNVEVDLNKEIDVEDFKVPQTIVPVRKSRDLEVSQEQKTDNDLSKCELKSETPKTNPQLIKKTSSLEKIINRFKKVRASVLPDTQENGEFKTIFEEKENMKVNVEVYPANRNLLPDLLSPNCSNITPKSSDFIQQLYLDSDEDKPRKPRESLGAALGVDHTFLDQFDLID